MLRGPRRRLTADTRAVGTSAERRAALHYRLRAYTVLARNARAGGNEIDLILRRGDRLIFCEVKAKRGDGFGDPLEMVTPEKQRRIRRAAEIWLAARPGLRDLHVSFEIVAVRPGGLERVRNAF